VLRLNQYNTIRHQVSIYFLIALSLFVGPMVHANNDPLEAIQLQRKGLINLISFVDRTPEIFARDSDANLLLNRMQKQEALDVWRLYIDYMSTLDQLTEQTKKSKLPNEHALAFTAHYRFGLEFLQRVKNDPEIVNWLNADHPEFALPKNLYRKFSKQLLSDWTTDSFDDFNLSFKVDKEHPAASDWQTDRTAIKNIGRLKMLTSNTTSNIGRTLYNTYYPVQKGVARGMGKVKVWRIGKTLITPEQALDFSRQFEPGDFHLTRKEWRLTNVGIPGFWTHSAMFIGTPEERTAYFDTPEVNDWVASLGADSYEQLLISVSPIYEAHPGVDRLGDIRVIEALDAGVIFNSIETSMDADGAVVFRPTVSKLEKAKAIYNSFYYTGRPYDFHFDFNSDDALVCTELIFKAYQASETQEGVAFPLNRAVGKKMLTPSEIAQWYEDTMDSPNPPLELVMFIDSNEKDRVAFQSSKEAFVGSWKRPDWYIFQQPTRPDDRLAAQNP
jgi:hypothetical protein